MRKTLTVASVGVALSMALVSEGLASPSEPNVTGPARVKVDEPFEFLVRNCKPGELVFEGGAEYWIPMHIFAYAYDPDGGYPRWTKFAADEDGETAIPATIFAPGTWTFEFYCLDEDGGDWYEGSWGPETMTVEVSGATPTLTAEERKRCNNKKSAKKRRACRKREASD